MSPVQIDCEIRGSMPDIPERFPEVADRVGIDLHPIDLADGERYRWLQALIWPDHADRIALLANARRIWLRNTPRVEAGDAIERLPGLIGDAPDSAALCVLHCHALNQFPAAALAAFAEILRTASRRRAIFHVSSEGERMTLTRIVDGRSDILISVVRSAHGRWIQW